MASQAKGVWQAGLPCFNDSITTLIEDTVTWDYSYPAYGDIIIDSAAVLTVKKTVYMPTTSKVIVKRGGKLIVDGGMFTNACDQVWKGIEVWGTKSEPPTTVGAHGRVTLINGAIVENAQYGLRTIMMKKTSGGGSGGLDNTPDYDYAGGQVIAYDSATIRNCIYGVYFYPYAYNHNSGFNDVSFITSDSLLTTTGKPLAHIYMNGVEGISFDGCTFANTRDSADVPMIYRGKGILSYESQYQVDGNCDSQQSPCPDSLITPSRFNDLYFGIDALFTTSNKFIDVRNSEFNENYRGLNASAMTAGRITSNYFDIDQPFEEDGGCGLYLDNCTGYWVEENTFTHSTGDTEGLGIVVNNSGSAANEIYRNEFTNLEQGIEAMNQNKGRVTGLQIRCNDFEDCDFDIFVAEPLFSGTGVAPYQGVNGTDPEDMAGNLFYIPSPTPNGDYDDLNNEADYFYYVYPTNPGSGSEDSRPVDYDSTSVGVIEKPITGGWDYDDGCPSQISSGGGGTKSSGSGYKDELIYYTGQVEALETTLQELIDGGNTMALNMEVEFSTPPETVEVYNELMGEAPFVSETVVETSIEKEDVLPNAMIRDVMVANPHSATSDELLDKLDERTVPMPDYMKAQVLTAREVQTIKSELESKLAGYKLKQAMALNGVVREYLSDTINPERASDSLVSLYESFSDKQVKHKLAMLHLQRGEYTAGTNVLDAILEEYVLSEEELVVHNTMVDYYNLVKGIKQVGRTEMEATEEEIGQLLDIELYGTGIAGSYARNALIALDEMEYLAPIQLPDLTKSAKEMEDYLEIMNSQPPSRLEAFPNPSKDYVIIHYLMEKESDGIIEIKDVNGILVETVIINKVQDQVTVKTEGWKPGMYIATINIIGNSIESIKFTLVK
ncbi:MAG: T9SS type A sorting domain-containing protein [Bacteroidales bacterium]|nr:T9SS type A sorting domain-containing protein [Bacteroidales bacterium]MCF8403567.1 T9SS type A sorting domain-containing protein [Bacteroidales bacterium]